jgi:glycosyltransferase involved in cell wall biosynthesis
MTRVTVIIPTFNRAAYLREAIDSAATQEDTLLLVSDNASSDDTPDVVADAVHRYGDHRVRSTRHESNIGWHANFNGALAMVDTEFALVLGDDDRLLPGAIERGLIALDAAPSAGIAHAACTTIDAAGRPINTATDWTKGLTRDTVEAGQVFIARTMPWSSRVFAHSVLIRHAAFQDPMWDPDDGAVADTILWMRIALGWDVAFVHKPAAERRVHDATLSTGFGGLTGDDYLFDPEAVLALRRAKLRFIDRFADRLDDPAALRRAAGHGARRDAAVYVRAGANRSRRAGMAALTETLRAQPSTVLEPIFWRAVARIVAGPREGTGPRAAVPVV